MGAILFARKVEVADKSVVDVEHPFQNGQSGIQVHGFSFHAVGKTLIDGLFIPQSSAFFQKNPDGEYLDARRCAIGSLNLYAGPRCDALNRFATAVRNGFAYAVDLCTPLAQGLAVNAGNQIGSAGPHAPQRKFP
jgi:hypothetical protein